MSMKREVGSRFSHTKTRRATVRKQRGMDAPPSATSEKSPKQKTQHDEWLDGPGSCPCLTLSVNYRPLSGPRACDIIIVIAMNDDNHSQLAETRRALAEMLRFAASRISDKDNYRTRLLKLSAQGRREDLHTSLSHSSVDNDMEELFAHFDKAFLELFPGFIEACHNLLPPAEGSPTPPRGRLTSEQRVIALMRLGMTDPRQIAATLGLSVGTVYNYRSRLRRRAGRTQP